MMNINISRERENAAGNCQSLHHKADNGIRMSAITFLFHQSLISYPTYTERPPGLIFSHISFNDDRKGRVLSENRTRP